MNPLMELPAPMRELLGVWQSLRKLGFPSDDIFAGVFPIANHPNRSLIVVEVRRPEKTARFNVEWWSDTDKAFVLLYESAVKLLLQASQEELHELWVSSRAYRESTIFVAALVGTGIKIPLGTSTLGALT